MSWQSGDSQRGVHGVHGVSMAGLWLPSSSWKACGFRSLQLDHAPPRCSLPRNNTISQVARKSGEQGSEWHSSRLNAVLFKWKLNQCSKLQNENYSQQTGCSSNQFQSCQKKADPNVGSKQSSLLRVPQGHTGAPGGMQTETSGNRVLPI